MLAPSHIMLLGLLVVLALVVFGPKRLPELGSSVGRAIQEFKHASSQAARSMSEVTDLSGGSTAAAVPTQVVAAAPISSNGSSGATVVAAPGEVTGR